MKYFRLLCALFLLSVILVGYGGFLANNTFRTMVYFNTLRSAVRDDNSSSLSPLDKWRNSRELDSAVHLKTSYNNVFAIPPNSWMKKDRKFTILKWARLNAVPEINHTLNCIITRNKSLIDQSDAVLITHRHALDIKKYPKTRHSWQRWIWYMDESPVHGYISSEVSKFGFNWTMTYIGDSDIYIPYGWTTELYQPTSIPSDIGNRDKLVVAVMSYCNNHNNARWKYLVALNKTVRVEGYGRCFGRICAGYAGGTQLSGCPLVSNYLFYLAFENSNCQEYITEKMFLHGFAMGTVPVVLGASKADYTRLTPPNSFIYARDFSSPAQLGEYLKFLSKNKEEYMKYHEWRKHYRANYRMQYVNETGMLTKLCVKLNQDTGTPKVYPDILSFWSPLHCEPGVQ